MKYPQIAVNFKFFDRPDVECDYDWDSGLSAVKGTGLLIAPGLAVARCPLGGTGYQVIHQPTGLRIGPTVRRQRTAIAAALKLAESRLCWPRLRRPSKRNQERAQPQWDEALKIMREDMC